MKKNSFIPGLCAMLVFGLIGGCAFHARAQEVNTTNALTMPPISIGSDPTISGGLQQIWDAAAGSTNFAVAVGGGRGVKGNKNLAFADYVYNISGNVGVILGYDAIKVDGGATTYNFVKGGLQLKADIYPFKNFGLETFKVTPFAAILMSSHSGNVGEIIVAGASHRWALSKSWGLNVGAFYENRSGGNDPGNGVYVCGLLAVSRNF